MHYYGITLQTLTRLIFSAMTKDAHTSVVVNEIFRRNKSMPNVGLQLS